MVVEALREQSPAKNLTEENRRMRDQDAPGKAADDAASDQHNLAADEARKRQEDILRNAGNDFPDRIRHQRDQDRHQKWDRNEGVDDCGISFVCRMEGRARGHVSTEALPQYRLAKTSSSVPASSSSISKLVMAGAFGVGDTFRISSIAFLPACDIL
jgi:hypothetical protein